MIISRYLEKYIGTYRVVAEYDKNTNDFPRDNNGNIDSTYDDIFIPCKYNNKIVHHGQNVLEAIIYSSGRGKNIIKSFYEIKTTNSTDEFMESDIVNFEKLEQKMIELKILKELIIADGEVYFNFYDKDIHIVAELMGAKTSGANIRPFSNKNLPKKKYQIPMEKLQEYKEITKVVPQGDLLIISRITKRFLVDILRKKAKALDINADMKLKMLKGKEYIHYMGFFDDYLKYLKNNLEANGIK